MKKILIALIVFIISIAPLSGCGKDNVKPVFPEDFLFAFEFGENRDQINGLNTYTNEIQKDLIYDGKAIIEYIPEVEDLNLIYNKIVELEIIEIDRIMNSIELTKSDRIIEVEPNVYYKILVFMDGKEYIIDGDVTSFSYIDEDNDAKNFYEFCEFMTDFIIHTEEFEELPDANGYYE